MAVGGGRWDHIALDTVDCRCSTLTTIPSLMPRPGRLFSERVAPQISAFAVAVAAFAAVPAVLVPPAA
jgi:hypothetical protein